MNTKISITMFMITTIVMNITTTNMNITMTTSILMITLTVKVTIMSMTITMITNNITITINIQLMLNIMNLFLKKIGFQLTKLIILRINKNSATVRLQAFLSNHQNKSNNSQQRKLIPMDIATGTDTVMGTDTLMKI